MYRQAFAKILLLATLALLVGATIGSEARAQCFGGAGFGYGGGYGFFPGAGYGRNLYSIGNVPIPPYFALHPPVYYGDRVRRSYGVSPFAYPPYPRFQDASGSRRSPRAATTPAKPQLVLNPYLDDLDEPQQDQDGDGKAVDVRLTSHAPQPQPQWIMNPFYEAEQAGGARLSAQANRKSR